MSIMSCSSCKKEGTNSNMSKEDVERLSQKVEKGVLIFFGIILIFSLYGIYKLITS
jgi:hypothetical protein